MKPLRYIIAVLVLAAVPCAAWATLPLITDDTETQGTGKFQFELSGAYDRDRETESGVGLRERDFSLTPTVTYGIIDTVDLYAGIPYNWTSQTVEGAESSTAVGIGDTRLGAKWRFRGGKEGLSFAVRPAITLPTGKYEQELGAGKMTFGTYFVSTYASELWGLHLNLGYTWNRNRIDERTNVWHASAAATYELTRSLKLCADTGMDTNRDRTSEVEPGYVLAGFIYSPVEHLELSLGLKASLNKPQSDWAALPGITYHY